MTYQNINPLATDFPNLTQISPDPAKKIIELVSHPSLRPSSQRALSKNPVISKLSDHHAHPTFLAYM
jgi:hypothetical protein